jgi:2-oxoglutarate dehydrogenase E1 component
MTNWLKKFHSTSALNGGNATYIETLYEQYLDHPESIPQTWQQVFKAIKGFNHTDTAHRPILDYFNTLSTLPPNQRTPAQKTHHNANSHKQAGVDKLTHYYRKHGHRIATTNPLQPPPDADAGFHLDTYDLDQSDLSCYFSSDLLADKNRLTLATILTQLKTVYCQSISAEYLHIVDPKVSSWVKTHLEHNTHHIDPERKIALLQTLTAAEGIEKYLHQTYIGQKRFSLEGGESLIALLDELVHQSSRQKVNEIVLGMAHRGRLNVLINILGKSPSLLFEEFENLPSHLTSNNAGDVKYHQGFSSNIATPTGPVHLALAFNPSHLEIISPVIMGSTRARQDRYKKNERTQVLPVVIHGDAAFAGQGIVMETLNMSATRAYTICGTIHIVINNQIGFTTSHPLDARSTLYCTDIAKIIQAPIFHVNADDPIAVIKVTQLALDFRMHFQKDVIIDLICYRRHGHNEADEPAVTQPLMYQTIRQHPTTLKLFTEQLIQQNIISADQATQIEHDYETALKNNKAISKPRLSDSTYRFANQWDKYFNSPWDTDCETQVPLTTLKNCHQQLLKLPPAFKIHPVVSRIMTRHRQMMTGTLPIDWGFAENMAYATLVLENENIRLTGQDVGRGTFAHRHAILHDQNNGHRHIPLQHINKNQGRFEIYDSLLSEAGVLAFEYGYSTTAPNTLVIWEAQFGDFANGAQVVIDQFITSGESKWGRLSGLVMLMPHGFEGQGAEHSSARLERFLQLCAEKNIQVCVPSTPAQIFHLLRRQQRRLVRKPLIIMSPKSLLRHKQATSTLKELTDGAFLPLIADPCSNHCSQIKTLILCSGKVYYDLARAKQDTELPSLLLIRIEQLYPFPAKALSAQLEQYPNLTELIWCQEEPRNQGSWNQVKHRLRKIVSGRFPVNYVGRPPSAAPASGNYANHCQQQATVINKALNCAKNHLQRL